MFNSALAFHNSPSTIPNASTSPCRRLARTEGRWAAARRDPHSGEAYRAASCSTYRRHSSHHVRPGQTIASVSNSQQVGIEEVTRRAYDLHQAPRCAGRRLREYARINRLNRSSNPTSTRCCNSRTFSFALPGGWRDHCLTFPPARTSPPV